MTLRHGVRKGGFTLIELLVALLVLALLATMSYRGLGAVLDAREHVKAEVDRLRRIASFFARFEQDVRLAAPRSVRTATGIAPAWRGEAHAGPGTHLEFSRFASVEGVDAARRLAYRLNERQEIELWLWPGLDIAPDALPARHTLLSDVAGFELRYLNGDSAWVDAWPLSALDPALPRAVRLRIVLGSGEEIMRVFALQS